MYKKLLVVIALLVPELASAYTIIGQVVDQSDSEPMPYCGVKLMKDSATVIVEKTTNESGWFYVSGVECMDVFVDVSCMGYTSRRTFISGNGEDVNIGLVALRQNDMTLGEVTVYGSSVIEKADRYLILPSTEELDRSAESIALLNNLMIKMPGIQVNTMLQSVTVEGRTPVFQINGKEEPFHKIQSLNPKNILRIEYRNTPDIRYADRGASGIINFITRPVQEGGSVMVNLLGSPQTGFFNGMITGTYFCKKSEWTLSYDNQWRDYDEQYISTQEELIGRDEPIYREQKALPSTMSYINNNISLDYTYMHDTKTMLSVSARLALSNSDNCRQQQVYELLGSSNSIYDKTNSNHSRIVSPMIDVYFRKQFNKKHLFEFNATANTSSGDYQRSMNYLYPDSLEYMQHNETQNKSWRINTEALYTRYYDNITMRYGINYSHNYRRNDYVENGGVESVSNLNRDNLYLYGDIAGKWKRLGYSIGIGAKYYRSADDARSKSWLRLKSTVTLNYRLSKRWSLNYLFMYDPKLPSLSMLSDQVNTVDDVMLKVGNLNVKPSTWHRNRLYLRYQSETFNATLWGSYSRTDNPIVSNVSYISDPSSPYYNMFMNCIGNGNFDDNINVQLNLGYHKLFNHLSLFAEVGYDDYRMVGDGYNGHKRNVYANASAQIYFGDWSIQAQFEIAPRYSLSGNTISRSTRFNVIGVQYHYNNWYFSCVVSNPFTRRGWLTTEETLSDVNPLFTTNFIKDNANMVTLGVIYRANFGKSFKKSTRGLNGGEIDTGVDVNY